MFSGTTKGYDKVNLYVTSKYFKRSLNRFTKHMPLDDLLFDVAVKLYLY